MPETRVSAAQSYWELSRSPRYSLTFALPLLALYEALAAALDQATGSGIRNGADAVLKELAASLMGRHGPVILGVALVVTMLVLIVRDRSRNPGGIRKGILAGMLAESVTLAIAFGVVVGMATASLLQALSALATGQVSTLSLPEKFVISLGAGLYEELVFRVLLVSGLLAGARLLFGWKRSMAATFAVVLGALIFAGFHYVGPYGDPLELPSFVFRTIAGLAFSGLYVTRGFGITAWTHALYDVFLILAQVA